MRCGLIPLVLQGCGSLASSGLFEAFRLSGNLDFQSVYKLLGLLILPLTMTMWSLWPWHHRRLWIINRGPDSGARRFVCRQTRCYFPRLDSRGLMACHKFIKRGSAVISFGLRFSDHLLELCTDIWALFGFGEVHIQCCYSIVALSPCEPAIV